MFKILQKRVEVPAWAFPILLFIGGVVLTWALYSAFGPAETTPEKLSPKLIRYEVENIGEVWVWNWIPLHTGTELPYVFTITLFDQKTSVTVKSSGFSFVPGSTWTNEAGFEEIEFQLEMPEETRPGSYWTEIFLEFRKGGEVYSVNHQIRLVVYE